MTRVHIFVEGQTEETFVRDLLIPYFAPRQIYLNSILVKTSASGKGGVVNYAQIKTQLERKCLEDKAAFVTTMFDLFRLPKTFPGVESSLAIADPLAKASLIERQIEQDLGYDNFFANLIVHEFEGLLYSNADCFADWFSGALPVLRKDMLAAASPEHINDGPTTAPSKRILRACPGYEKVLHGPLIATSIGLEVIRSKCVHFDAWLNSISKLAKGSLR